jgi:hypothetical protein
VHKNLDSALEDEAKAGQLPSPVKPDPKRPRMSGAVTEEAGSMSCMCRNCRGLRSDVTVRELHNIVKRFQPTVLCMVETQIHKSQVEGLARSLGFDNCFAASSTGRSGGLGMFWNNDINLGIFPFSHYHIDARITKSNGRNGE